MFIRGMFVPRSIQLFFEGEAGGGGGGGTPTPIPDASADLTRRLAAAEGSASVVAQQLANENYQLRVSERNKADDVTRLTAQVADLNTKLTAAKTPEGAVILTKEEGVIWEALKAMGKPEEIKTKLESVPALEKKIADSERATVIAKAADLEGYKDAEVLASLIGDSVIEFKQVDVNGKKQDAPFIKLTENGVEKVVRLSEHIEAAHAKFLPVLKPATSPQGGPHVKQAPAGPTGGTDVYQKIRDKKKQEQEAKKNADKPLSERLNLAKSA
jgi:hypothetical protein